MYDTYDEEYKKQLNEIFGDGYMDDPKTEWETEEMEYKEFRELERKGFEGRKGHGKEAHAYDDRINNIAIMQLRDEGKSLDEIAELIGCSKSTIRNRLHAMGIKTGRRRKIAVENDKHPEDMSANDILDEDETNNVYKEYTCLMAQYERELKASVNKRAAQKLLANNQPVQKRDPNADASRIMQMQKADKSYLDAAKRFWTSPSAAMKRLRETGL